MVEPRTAQRWIILQGAVMLAAGMLASCSPVQPPAATVPASFDPGTAPIIGAEPTSGGIYVPLGSYAPLTGEALTKALSDRQTILAATKSSPALTTQPTSQPASQATSQAATSPGNAAAASTTDASSEPPPLAVKYYLQGRESFLEGANSQAMDFLDKALALDPNAFTVLRLMGRVCFASSQLARGSLFLQRAYAIEPIDVEVNYLLGRYWLERKDDARAVCHLLQADDSPERAISSAQTPLVSFYLARALQAAGYHKAAAAEYERFLANITLPVAGYRYDRELNYLMEETWAAHLSAAENDVLVGDYVHALAHYQAAKRHQLKSAFIISRLVNAQIHCGHPEDARLAALALVTATEGSEESIQLLAWTYRALRRENDLLADLRARIAAAPADDPAPTLTLAAAQDYLAYKDQAFDTLRIYLEGHPQNLSVLERLGKRVDSPATFARLLQATGTLLAKSPGKHDDILKLFTPLTDLPAAAALAHEGIPKTARTAHEAYLYGITFRAQRDFKLAETAFREAAQARGFFPAREALVSTLIAEEKFREASDIIQDAIIHNEGGPKAYQLLIESEGAQERLASALKIAKDARQKFPENPELRLQLATIYRLRGQNDEADGELAALIDGSPKYEQAYKSLINALLIRAREGGRDGQKLQSQGVAFLARLLREIPNSTYGRVTSAILSARDGLEDSEVLLRHLHADHPDDVEVLLPLAQIRQALGRPAEAAETLEAALKSHPTPELAQALAELLRSQEKPAEALAVTERLRKQNPGNETYLIVHAAELLAQKRQAEAILLLAEAVQKFPQSQPLALSLARLQSTSTAPESAVATMTAFIQKNGETAQRLYLLAHFQSHARDDQGNESTLLRLLALMPDHTGGNNDLGYLWADAGKNLELAETMIKKALENQPNNPAFLDSLGWVYYKQGRFADAITFFEKAIALPTGREPEVVQHLGDALYRAGKIPDATERWFEARTLLFEGATALSKDQQKIKTYLDAALAAVKSGGTPALSPLAKPGPVRSASPATAPRTTPQ